MTRDKPPTKISDEALIMDVKNYPDDYQWERAKRLGVAQSAIHYALKRLTITVKKTLRPPNADAQIRQAFVERIHHYEQAGKPIVYLDESGFAQSMPRTHGYSTKGWRCFGTH
ncbi:IS630 transposase-related protein, partial [Xenorhabdus sp. XENO-10]|nr:IS630 transposase-related protein [Xenorhabdus yunnanensis]